MLTLAAIRAQLNHILAEYLPVSTHFMETVIYPGGNEVDRYMQGIEMNINRGGISLESAYQSTLYVMVLNLSQESQYEGGINYFPNSPKSGVGESSESWLAKVVPADLVNALYGANVPAATRTELVKQIEAGALDRKDFTGAFLSAKVNDGIAVPTANDIMARADALNLTPDTLQFDDDHVLTHIYLGAFGRAPDGDGLAYWKAKVDEIGIMRTTEALYRGGLENGELDGSVSNTAFVTNFYQSILGRTPDAPGLAFWVEKLDAGLLDRGFAIHAFVEGTSDGRDAKYVNNKALVAQAFADATQGKTADSAMLKAAKDVLATVSEKDATALAALDAIANGSALKASATTAKIATLDWLDTSGNLLFDGEDADSQHAGTDHADDATGIALVGITADDAAVLL